MFATATSAIVSAEMVVELRVWIAAVNGREAALVLRKVRRFGMGSIMADHAPPRHSNKKESTSTSSCRAGSIRIVDFPQVDGAEVDGQDWLLGRPGEMTFHWREQVVHHGNVEER